ncbi:CDP-glucose 4,6-dehydratase [Acidihalobacter ferrooxydans]|uniref:CDP-glucose 4,6-dehydratase n=1 Tax=Acidihalobacter ferrooxydans TaxID=1765967 RepID=A0A1P8ULF9_9GAMM|nr:CDP-glucose 4,6-dehydratase [Acidihalobacter ferrooxydans]APZ44665.1 CDP-glucose 4,6-dehydratase [Acidihalobacter ferrooxydans]
MDLTSCFRGRTVLVTGHTGFKGSWLCEWLLLLGARVVGVSLPADPDIDPCYTTPYAHFDQLDLSRRLTAHIEADVRDGAALHEAVRCHRPDFVFHLAAQPLVLRGYREPRWTVETNVIGTLNVLEAVRQAAAPCVVIAITTDKVYANRNWDCAYRETDPLGGHDPYSASKAAAEHVIASYWASFFAPAVQELGIGVAAARGGNVIGGGDWAADRIVPDTLRHLAEGRPVPLRNPGATRPWQHVLELLGGYLHLARSIALSIEAARAGDEAGRRRLEELCSPFNFGPALDSNRSVGELVEEIMRHWPGEIRDASVCGAPKEAGKLNLSIDQAWHVLGWRPQWEFHQTVRETVAWYRAFYTHARGDPSAVQALTQEQIERFTAGMRYDAPAATVGGG